MTNEAEPGGAPVTPDADGAVGAASAVGAVGAAGTQGGRVEGPADWRHSARCRHTDPDTLFVQGALQRDAREVCRACPVRTECLAHALDNRIRFGVWGGMTERERRAVLRRRPDVVSWADLLESARRAASRGAPAPTGEAARSGQAHDASPARSRRASPERRGRQAG